MHPLHYRRSATQNSTRARRRGAVSAAFLIGCVLTAPVADARSCRVNLIPHGAKFQCSTCHTTPTGGPRNFFGKDVELVVTRNGCEEFWGRTLAGLDSDQDGLTNGQELQDPAGEWERGMPNPGDGALVTRPGEPDRPVGQRFIRADFSADGLVDLTDAIATLQFLFIRGSPPECMRAADTTGDDRLNVTDAIATIIYFFGGAPRPPAPYPGCGFAEGSLDCAAHDACP